MEEEPNPQPPQSIQVPGTPSGAPAISVQVLPQTERQSLEQQLATHITRTTKESNRAESQVSRQVLLVAAATLALLGSLTSGEFTNTAIRILLTITIVLLATSIVTGIVQFCIEFLFWRSNRNDLLLIQKQIASMSNDAEKSGAARMGVAKINESSNRICFWAQISTFILSVVLLSAVVILRLYT